MNGKTGQLYAGLDRIRKHPVFALMVFIGTVVIALATFTDSIKKLTELTEAVSPEQARGRLVKMAVPFDSTAFVEAAAKGDLATVKLFFAAGMDVNAAAENGEYEQLTALMAASLRNRLLVVEVLLDAHADVNTIYQGTETALSLAADDEKIVKLLLAHGADADTISGAFSSAACLGDLKRVQYFWPLLKTPTQAVSNAFSVATGCVDSKPVSQEIDQGKAAVIDFLLQHGADINTRREGWGALHIAARNGMPLVIQTLLAAGADINQKCECSGFLGGGWTALALVLDSSRREDESFKQVFDLLIDRGADVNAVSNSGQSVLIQAIEAGDERKAMKLIDKGADVNARILASLDQIRVAGTTPLMFAMRESGMKEVVLRLLDQGADVNASNENGWTPLMWAAWSAYNDPNYIDILLAHGAEIDARNKVGRSALMLAVIKGRGDIVAILSAHGANTKTPDTGGKTAGMLAEENLEGQRKTAMLALLAEAQPSRESEPRQANNTHH